MTKSPAPIVAEVTLHDDKNCLHCAIWRAIQRHMKADDDGNDALTALSGVMADIIAGVPIQFQADLIMGADITLRANLALHAAQDGTTQH